MLAALVLGALTLGTLRPTEAIAAPPATTPPNDDGARTLTLQAKAAFDAGRFAEAADLLSRAYALKPSATLLYNMGRAYQQAGDKQRAIDAYEKYLATESFPTDEGAVKRSIEQLKQEIAKENSLHDQAATEKARADREAAEREKALREKADAEERAKHKASALPWIVTGVGVGGVVAGVIVGALASAAHDDAVAEPQAAAAETKQASAANLALAANVTLIAGGVIALTGLVWGIFDVRAAASSHKVSIGIGPGSVFVGVRF